MNLMFKIYALIMAVFLVFSCCIVFLFILYHENIHQQIGYNYGADECNTSIKFNGIYTSCYFTKELSKEQYDKIYEKNVMNEIVGYNFITISLTLLGITMIIISCIFGVKIGEYK